MTCAGPPRARRGAEMADVAVREGVGVLVGDDGRIAGVGAEADLRRRAPDAERQQVDGVLFPGFVDAHTHAVFGAARLDDQARRAAGMDYKAIAAEGGGILQSVRDFRECDVAELTALTRRRLDHLLAAGTTTVEIKSGYGLTTAAELRALEAATAAAGAAPSAVVTFLGAHEVPPEWRHDRAGYVRVVTDEMLPAVVRQGLARFCDVFCEPGVFTVAESRTILRAAQQVGLGVKLHADELDGSGGAELAAELGAISADHLARVSEAGIAALAAADRTVAVLLPGTMLFLGKGRDGQAPARRLIDAGCSVALATDFNPGSSPGMSLPLMAMLGVSQLGMTPGEAVTAITVNGAAALDLAGDRGQIASGFRADLVLMAIRDWRELPYWYGANLVSEVWVEGRACHPRRRPVNFVV